MNIRLTSFAIPSTVRLRWIFEGVRRGGYYCGLFILCASRLRYIVVELTFHSFVDMVSWLLLVFICRRFPVEELSIMETYICSERYHSLKAGSLATCCNCYIC